MLKQDYWREFQAWCENAELKSQSGKTKTWYQEDQTETRSIWGSLEEKIPEISAIDVPDS